jgi:trimeric autotransporter adhesin
MNTLSLQFKKVTPLCLIVFALGCLALLPRAQAVDPSLDEDFSIGDTAQGLDDNTAVSADTLCNMMMLANTPYGCHALEGNTTGFANTAIGFWALKDNAMGNRNTAIGWRALEDNVMGSNNTAIGFAALYYNTGSDNIALGHRAAVYHIAGDHNIYIGAKGGLATEDGQIRIGSPDLQTGTYIAGIRNAAVTGSPVVIGMGGKLGVTMSSAQLKEAIKPMEKASETILALKPVTFHYKKAVDPDGIPQFGLVAEQVEKVNPDLIARDADGKPYTVRYDAVNAMLLNEFLKEHKTVQEQGAIIAQIQSNAAKQEAIIARQQKQIEELAVGLQKVSAQVELSKHAPQTVLNSQ